MESGVQITQEQKTMADVFREIETGNPIIERKADPVKVVKDTKDNVEPIVTTENKDHIESTVTLKKDIQIIEPETSDVNEQAPTDNFSQMLKEHSGGKFSSWEEINNLLLSDNNTVKEPEFKDDFSRNLYDNISNGNIDAVTDVLTIQKRLKDVDKWDSEKAIKESWRLQHPEWDEEDISDEYNIRFENINSEDSTEKRRANRLLKEEGRKSIEYLKGMKKEINLPKIERQISNTPTVNPDEFKEAERLYKEGISSLGDDFGRFDFKVSDDDMEINTHFSIDPLEKNEYIKSMQSFDVNNIFNISNVLKENYLKGNKIDVPSLAKDMWMIKHDAKGVPNWVKVVTSQVRKVFSDAKLAFEANLKGRSQVAELPGDTNIPKQRKEIDNYMKLTS